MVAEHTGIAGEEGVELLLFVVLGVFVGNLGMGGLLVGVAVGDGVFIVLLGDIEGFVVESCAGDSEGLLAGG